MLYKFIAFKDKEVEGQWRVESMHALTKEPVGVVFFGFGAEDLAKEYADFKNTPVQVPAPVQISKPEAITIQVQDGRSVVLNLNHLSWSHDKKRGTVTARQKDIVESIGE